MAQVAHGWEFSVDRGPEWLFVRPHGSPDDASDTGLAEQVWSLLEQNRVHRLVLELDDIRVFNSHLIGQLVWLHKRIHTHDGLMRICGLSARNQDVLRQSRLDSRFPSHANRCDAVMGYRPSQPR